MNTELTARESFEYDHKPVRAGQDFKATEMHARILVHAGRATYKTRDMKAVEAPLAATAIESDPATDEPANERPKRSGRRYARRDMQADETSIEP